MTVPLGLFRRMGSLTLATPDAFMTTVHMHTTSFI